EQVERLAALHPGGNERIDRRRLRIGGRRRLLAPTGIRRDPTACNCCKIHAGDDVNALKFHVRPQEEKTWCAYSGGLWQLLVFPLHLNHWKHRFQGKSW